MQNLDGLIASLNAIQTGELESIRVQLESARVELEQRDLAELVTKLDECLAALKCGDLKNFRRLKETIVSRLGHLR
jgi:hypothetical protein